MALYPTWGCGQKISVRDWTVFKKTNDELIIKVFKDGKYRFGGYRSMDVLRLWAMDGMDTVLNRFYSDIFKSIDSDREVRFRRRLFDELTRILEALSRDNHVKLLFRKSIDDVLRRNYAESGPSSKRRRRGLTSASDFLEGSQQYRLYRYENYEQVPRQNDDVEDVDDCWHELSPLSASGDNGAGAFYDTLVYDQLSRDERRLEPSALHQGFNDRSGIRRWMLDGGLRFERFRRGTDGNDAFENFNELVPDFSIMQHAVTEATLMSDFVDVLRVAASAVISPSPEYSRPFCVFQGSGYDFDLGGGTQKAVQLFDVTYDKNKRPSHLGPMQAQFALDATEVPRAQNGLSFRTRDTKLYDLGCGFGVCATIQSEESAFTYLPIQNDATQGDERYIAHVTIPLVNTPLDPNGYFYSRADDPALNMILAVDPEKVLDLPPVPNYNEYFFLSQIAMKDNDGTMFAVAGGEQTTQTKQNAGDNFSDCVGMLCGCIIIPLFFLTDNCKTAFIGPMHNETILIYAESLTWFEKERGESTWSKYQYSDNDGNKYDVEFGENYQHDYMLVDEWRSAFNVELYDDACVASNRSSWPRSHTGFSNLLLQPLPFHVNELPVASFLEKVKEESKKEAKELFENCFEFIPHERSASNNPILLGGDPIEFFAAGDGIQSGWSIGGTPMALIDGLELGVGYVDLAIA